MVVPDTPGGGTDAVARQISEPVATANHWVIVADNKPGTGGNIGLDAVAKAAPNGYTFGMGQTANLAINPTLLAPRRIWFRSLWWPRSPWCSLCLWTQPGSRCKT